MKGKLSGLSRQYQAALRKHLKQDPSAGLQQAKGLGRQAVTIGLETLELARIHEQALIKLVLPRDSPRLGMRWSEGRGLFLPRLSPRSKGLIAPRARPTS